MLNAFSRIMETSATTGTGALTLAGAVDGYNRFDDFLTAGADTIVPYWIIEESTGKWECGVGIYSAVDTLTRTKIIANSAIGTSAINFASGTLKVFMADTDFGWGAGRHNLAAAGRPLFNTDNYADGYGQGSFVYSSNAEGNDLFVCVNPGTPSSPNASWVKANAGVRMTVNGGNVTAPFGIGLGVEEDYAASDEVTGMVGVGVGGEGQLNNGLVQGHGYNADYAYGAHQTERGGLILTTADATPTKLVNADWAEVVSRDHVLIPESSTVVFSGYIVAHIESGTSKVWFVEFGVQRVGAGNPALLAAATVTAKFGTTGTAPSVAVNTTSDSIETTVTGVAATDIRWTFSLTAVTAAARA